MKADIITDKQQWNDFIATSTGCNITQTYEWGELLKFRNDEVLPIGVLNDEGQLCAAMLIIISRISVLPTPYFYAPRGPVIEDPDSEALDILLAFTRAEARKRHAFMLKIEPGVTTEDQPWPQALKKRGFVSNPEARHLRHEWVLDLRPDEAKLMAGMKKTWRYCVRLAGRKDVTVRIGNDEKDLDIFYQLLNTTSDRDSFFIYGKDFYQRLLELYGDRARLLIAEYEGQPLGAALLIAHGRWCWYMYGASSNEQRDRMPNHLLQWTAFQWAKQQGCWYYNFRGIPDILEEGQPMWGVYVFKSGFGGYAMRAMETQDQAYIPIIYTLYRRLLQAKLWYNNRKAQKQLVIAEQKKAAIKQEQKNKEQQENAPQTSPEPATKPAEPAAKSGQSTAKAARTKAPKTPMETQVPETPTQPEVPETPLPETPAEQSPPEKAAAE